MRLVLRSGPGAGGLRQRSPAVPPSRLHAVHGRGPAHRPCMSRPSCSASEESPRRPRTASARPIKPAWACPNGSSRGIPRTPWKSPTCSRTPRLSSACPMSRSSKLAHSKKRLRDTSTACASCMNQASGSLHGTRREDVQRGGHERRREGPAGQFPRRAIWTPGYSEETESIDRESLDRRPGLRGTG